MPHDVMLWLLVAAFSGAGLFNMVGRRATKDDFARWGYPRWWCRVTGGLEIAGAALIALRASRVAGLILGASIVAVAAITVLRRREFSHAAPLGLFAVLLVIVAIAS